MGMMSFFSSEESSLKSTPTCSNCGLYRTCKSPRIGGVGSGKVPLLFVGDIPGKLEDTDGMQLVSFSDKMLTKILWKEFNIHLKDCRKVNAVNCRPPDGRLPTNNEMISCYSMLSKEIEEYKPRAIVLLGEIPLKSVIGRMLNKAPGGVNKWRGFVVPDNRYNTYLIPTMSPTAASSFPENPVVELYFKRDLQTAIDIVLDKIPYKSIIDIENMLSYTGNLEKSISLLKRILKISPEYLTFDYETTGLKPYNKGHKIVCVSFCFDENKAYAIPFFRKNKEYMMLFREIMRNKDIGKTSHNIQFEDTWTVVKAGCRVRNWRWDSMLSTHILDNRSNISGLKFQSIVNFGVVGYENELGGLLMSPSANEINSIHKIPPKTLLKYCAIDSLLEYRLFMKQKEMAKL